MKSSGNVARETFIRRIVKDLGLFCYPPSVSKHFFLLLYFFMEEKKCWVELHVLSYVIKKSSKGHVLKVKQRACLGSSWTLPAISQVLGGRGSMRLEDYHAVSF